MKTDIPLKPFAKGSLSTTVFGGPSTSALDVLERGRVVLSARGAWSARGWTAVNPGGAHGRCMRQVVRDVDGVHQKPAEALLIKAIKELHPSYSSIESFNDAKTTHKHHVLEVWDRAIEMAHDNGK